MKVKFFNELKLVLKKKRKEKRNARRKKELKLRFLDSTKHE